MRISTYNFAPLKEPTPARRATIQRTLAEIDGSADNVYIRVGTAHWISCTTSFSCDNKTRSGICIASFMCPYKLTRNNLPAFQRKLDRIQRSSAAIQR